MTDTVITLPRSVVELALENLQCTAYPQDYYETVKALRAALEQKCPCGATQQSQIDECAYANCSMVEQPKVDQEQVAWLREDGKLALNDGGMFSGNWKPLYTHQQNLNCKSTQARLATLWGYVKPKPPRQPLTDDAAKTLCYTGPVYAPDGKVTRTPEQYKREIADARLYGLRQAERAHGIGGEQ